MSKVKTQLPLSRCRRVIRADADVHSCSQQAMILAAVATEKLIARLVERALQSTLVAKRKTVQVRDLSRAVSKNEQFMFLADAIQACEEELKSQKCRAAGIEDENQTLLSFQAQF